MDHIIPTFSDAPVGALRAAIQKNVRGRLLSSMPAASVASLSNISFLVAASFLFGAGLLFSTATTAKTRGQRRRSAAVCPRRHGCQRAHRQDRHLSGAACRMYFLPEERRIYHDRPETPGATASFPSGEALDLGIAIRETVEPIC